MKIKITTKAWVTDYTRSEFFEAKAKNDHERIVAETRFTNLDMTAAGWVNVGTAEIEVTLHDDGQVKENLVASLLERKKALVAETQVQLNQIEEKIQSLLAISYDG